MADAYATSTSVDSGQPTKESQSYAPTAREQKVVTEVMAKYENWRKERLAHEPQWFINTAFYRGQHYVTWSSIDNKLVHHPNPPHRIRRVINRLFAKVRARRAKFLRNRPKWIVHPSTTDLQDKMNARATQKVLDYLWRKMKLESKYRDALGWAEVAGRGYWWFYWDPDQLGRVEMSDPTTGEKTVEEAVLGDVAVEVGSPFEVLVGDPSLPSLTYQQEIIRVKEVPIETIHKQYGSKGKKVAPEGYKDENFRYEFQISRLNSQNFGFGYGGSTSNEKKNADGEPNTVIRIEYFRRPTPDLPKGKYCVIANNVLLREQDELPYGFWDFENPFPCVEFQDVPTTGQYWGTTVVEQLIEPQREYNMIRSMVSTQLRQMAHPKLKAAKQHQIADGAWSPDSGEILEYVARPGIKEPEVIQPPNIASDAWRLIELLRSEFDEIPQIFPASEGQVGGSQSGFQTNLLQEATDSVHAPDIRAHEMAIEDAAYKIRRISKQGYFPPRLITIAGRNREPDILQFSRDDIDEYADIEVQALSSMPDLKYARIQSALDLYAKGVFGDPTDPNVRKQVLSLLDMSSLEDVYDAARRDEDMAHIENSEVEEGAPLQPPMFFENHNEHVRVHFDKLKAPATRNWPDEWKLQLLAHTILHVRYINPDAAFQMSMEAGLQGLIPPPALPALPQTAPAAPGVGPGVGGPLAPQAAGPPQPEPPGQPQAGPPAPPAAGPA